MFLLFFSFFKLKRKNKTKKTNYKRKNVTSRINKFYQNINGRRNTNLKNKQIKQQRNGKENMYSKKIKFGLRGQKKIKYQVTC